MLTQHSPSQRSRQMIGLLSWFTATNLAKKVPTDAYEDWATRTGQAILTFDCVPLTCHYGRYPRDTPGRSGPRNSHRAKHTPVSSNSSQADSAGSIPVTRSTREKRCSTSDFGRIAQANQRSLASENGARATARALSHLGQCPLGGLSVAKLTVRVQIPGAPLLQELGGRSAGIPERVCADPQCGA